MSKVELDDVERYLKDQAMMGNRRRLVAWLNKRFAELRAREEVGGVKHGS